MERPKIKAAESNNMACLSSHIYDLNKYIDKLEQSKQANVSEKEPQEWVRKFTNIAVKTKHGDTHISTDGVALICDNEPHRAFSLHEGGTYEVTVRLLKDSIESKEFEQIIEKL